MNETHNIIPSNLKYANILWVFLSSQMPHTLKVLVLLFMDIAAYPLQTLQTFT